MNFKNIVLIDFESVQPEALPGLDLPNWHLMLFVGANQIKVPLALALAMQRMGDRAQYVQISVVRSASPPWILGLPLWSVRQTAPLATQLVAPLPILDIR
jgi:hypothetical protein